MKKLIMILAIALAVVLFSGCASRTNIINWYSAGTVEMMLRGEATSIVWLGLFGSENFPSAERVARENGITRIASVERYRRLGTFGLWVEFTTIVTGEGPGIPPAEAEAETEDEEVAVTPAGVGAVGSPVIPAVYYQENYF